MLSSPESVGDDEDHEGEANDEDEDGGEDVEEVPRSDVLVPRQPHLQAPQGSCSNIQGYFYFIMMQRNRSVNLWVHQAGHNQASLGVSSPRDPPLQAPIPL